PASTRSSGASRRPGPPSRSAAISPATCAARRRFSPGYRLSRGARMWSWTVAPVSASATARPRCSGMTTRSAPPSCRRTRLAGRVVGAAEGIVYLRHEYEAPRAALERELARARAAGALADSPPVRIFVSAGGYICGEETALLEALEGKRAEPRNKPPFPGTHGLWGKPTLINNVETLCMIPAILRYGGTWFKSQGRNNGGLKYLGLSGHVERPGIYQVPLGLSVAEFINEYGGGVSAARKLKAFSPGGASSGFLPASMAGTALDFQSLTQVGSMLGSGAVVALAEGT